MLEVPVYEVWRPFLQVGFIHQHFLTAEDLQVSPLQTGETLLT